MPAACQWYQIQSRKKLARPEGFEPPTLRSEVHPETDLSDTETTQADEKSENSDDTK